MTPAELSRTVVRAVRSAVDEGVLAVAVPDDVKVERPRPGGGGDYASAVALKLAASSGLAPRAVAEALRGRLTGAPGVARVDITGPGFLNFTLDAGPAAHDELVRRVLALGPRYGHGDSLSGQHTSFAPVDEPRALAVTSVVVELLRSQGATAEITPYGSERLHVLPDPEIAHLAGPHAARWAYLRAAAHDRPAPAAELLAQRDSNPYFRVRYAYTRTRALTRNAHALGFTGAPGETGDPDQAAPSTVSSPTTPTSFSAPHGWPPPTGSRGSSKASPTPFSTSSTPCCRSGTRNPWPPTVPGSRSPKPPGRCWPVACPCSVSTPLNSCELVRVVRVVRVTA